MLARLYRTLPHLSRVPGLPNLFDAFLMGHTALFHHERLSALHEIELSVISWPGVMTKIHRFGGTEFTLGRREIGHLHGNGLLDIPFSKELRNQLINQKLVQPHHIFPKSNWVSFYVRTVADVPRAVYLLRLNYERWKNTDAQQV